MTAVIVAWLTLTPLQALILRLSECHYRSVSVSGVVVVKWACPK